MTKHPLSTPDIANKNYTALAVLFPNVVTETVDENGNGVRAIDAEILSQEINTRVISEKEERYQFTWPGKKKAMLLANSPVTASLRPCREESVNFDDTENLYIEGDNLDVLKLLCKTHSNFIKMIYIDPPYNTGGKFIYDDNFTMGSDQWAMVSGQYNDYDNENSGLMAYNSDNSGRFHTNWLNMIYPRLMIARNLLTDEGVIFISIDDREIENLKKICNEIFGADNFVACFNWQTKKAAQGMITENMVVENQEYILTYAKQKSQFRFIGKKRDENNGFSNPDNDPRGLWKRQYLQRLGQGLPLRTLTDSKTGNVFTFETPYTQEKLDKWVNDGYIIFPQDKDKYPARKEFLSEYGDNQQLVTSLGLYPTKAATEKLYELFDGKKIFTNPKPETLLHDLISWTVKSGDIILDFFSGSAATAHAVMRLNAEDNGRRKFIMVQLQQEITEANNKAAYNFLLENNMALNICEIGKERIRRAGKRVKSDQWAVNSDNRRVSSEQWAVDSEKNTDHSLDIGFRVFKLDSGL